MSERLFAEYMLQAAYDRVASSCADLAEARQQIQRVLRNFKDLPVLHALVDFEPTAEAINALPEGLRKYIHNLQTNADPAGNVGRIMLLEEQVAGLTVKVGQPMEDSSYDRKQLMLRFIDKRKERAGADGESDGDIEGVITGLIMQLAEHMSDSQMQQWIHDDTREI